MDRNACCEGTGSWSCSLPGDMAGLRTPPERVKWSFWAEVGAAVVGVGVVVVVGTGWGDGVVVGWVRLESRGVGWVLWGDRSRFSIESIYSPFSYVWDTREYISGKVAHSNRKFEIPLTQETSTFSVPIREIRSPIRQVATLDRGPLGSSQEGSTIKSKETFSPTMPKPTNERFNRPESNSQEQPSRWRAKLRQRGANLIIQDFKLALPRSLSFSPDKYTQGDISSYLAIHSIQSYCNQTEAKSTRRTFRNLIGQGSHSVSLTWHRVPFSFFILQSRGSSIIEQV